MAEITKYFFELIQQLVTVAIGSCAPYIKKLGFLRDRIQFGNGTKKAKNQPKNKKNRIQIFVIGCFNVTLKRQITNKQKMSSQFIKSYIFGNKKGITSGREGTLDMFYKIFLSCVGLKTLIKSSFGHWTVNYIGTQSF